MKEKFTSFYFDVAERTAQLSYAKRLKVGAVIVKDHRILSYGYNGTPVGFDNVCETEINGDLVTKPEVIHAEQNAILKLARHGDSSSGATLFITHAPCVECAKLILQSGIDSVFYRHEYRSTEGIDLLRIGGVNVRDIPKQPTKAPGSLSGVSPTFIAGSVQTAPEPLQVAYGATATPLASH